MANKKVRLGKPSKASSGLVNKVRFDFSQKNFMVATPKKKAHDGKRFKNHDEALEYAKSLE